MVIKHHGIRHCIVFTEVMAVKSGTDTITHIKKAPVYHDITGHTPDTKQFESLNYLRNISVRECWVSIRFDHKIAFDRTFVVTAVIVKSRRPAKLLALRQKRTVGGQNLHDGGGFACSSGIVAIEHGTRLCPSDHDTYLLWLYLVLFDHFGDCLRHGGPEHSSQQQPG